MQFTNTSRHNGLTITTTDETHMIVPAAGDTDAPPWHTSTFALSAYVRHTSEDDGAQPWRELVVTAQGMDSSGELNLSPGQARALARFLIAVAEQADAAR